MMKMRLFHYLLIVAALSFVSCDSGPRKALIETSMGDITVMLYDSTPKHRENFIKLVKENFYDSLLFHRVIDGFMIQGGDPTSKNAKPGQALGAGSPGYRVEAEIGAPHLRGVMATARGGNPQKESNGSQFYLVDGNPVTDAMLDRYEQANGFQYNETQRALYKEIGGRPDLDGKYTVFGEVLEGLDVVDKIAAIKQKDARNRPVEDVWMKIKMLN